MSKTLCIIQARMGSTRLPGKVLKEVGGTPLLEYMLRRVGRTREIGKIVVATTTSAGDAAIEALCKKLGVDCFRGSEDDVLDRYYRCAQKYPECDTIVRLTGDCPLIDPALIDEAVRFFGESDFDYIANMPLGGGGYPEGVDVEVFSGKALEISSREAKKLSEREHVTLYMRSGDRFARGIVPFRGPRNLAGYRLTVDNPEDFEVISFLMQECAPDAEYMAYVELLDKHPEIMEKNAHIERNVGLKKALREDGVNS